MKKLNLIIFFLLLFGLYSCDESLELLVLKDSFNSDVEYVTDSKKSYFEIELLSDRVWNPILKNFEYIRIFPKKNIKQKYFSQMGWTFISDGYYDECLISICIEDIVIEYDEHGQEIDRKKEIVELVPDNQSKIFFRGENKFDIAVDLNYSIKEYSTSTSFTIALFQMDGESPVSFLWGLDNLEILVINEE